MFKFSLKFCIWLAVLMGSVLGLVLDTEPWVLDSHGLTLEQIEKELNLKVFERRNTSPDGTRKLLTDHDLRYSDKGKDALSNIFDLETQQVLYRLKGQDLYIHGFLNDDTILASMNTPNYFHLYRRQFPEWRSGIFYRPLFWIAVAVFIGSVFEFVSMRKRLRNG